MISDQEVEQALDYLRDNAEVAAQAAANHTYMVEYRKSLKALLRSQSKGKTEGAKDDYAYAHPDYLKHLEALKEAVYQHERHKFLMKAAEAKIDAWRTASANQRIGP